MRREKFKIHRKTDGHDYEVVCFKIASLHRRLRHSKHVHEYYYDEARNKPSRIVAKLKFSKIFDLRNEIWLRVYKADPFHQDMRLVTIIIKVPSAGIETRL